METHPRFALNIPRSPGKQEICNFSLLSETESDRINSSFISNQINELKAQLEIVNEDRERLKKENEKLKHENFKISKMPIASKENEKIATLQQEIVKLRKECEEKDHLLNKMRSLLGKDEAIVLKENRESKMQLVSPMKVFNSFQSRLPGRKTITKPNRSISPYSNARV